MSWEERQSDREKGRIRKTNSNGLVGSGKRETRFPLRATGVRTGMMLIIELKRERPMNGWNVVWSGSGF